MPVRENVAEYLGELDVPPEHRANAVLAVASASVDADECRMLLEMLGLNPREGWRKLTAE
jgi:hypothetical protein